MQEAPENIERRVIPRWRMINRTPALELLSARRSDSIQIVPQVEFEKFEVAWSTAPSTGTAAELVAAGLLYGKSSSSESAARSILSNHDATSSVRQLANAHLGNPDVSGADAPSLPAEDKLRRRLSIIKSRLNNQPRNAILHVEAARIYAILGQVRAANHRFQIALSIIPSNRFVVRSAGRFFVHEKDFERAHALFVNSPATDPWLLASRIATGQLAGVKQTHTRAAQALLESGLAPGQITELAAALGTLELGAGNRKKAKRFFKISALDPNDNAVAQLRWAAVHLNMDFDNHLLERELTFEARASHAAASEDWDAALDNCKLWINDEPFSVRPAHVGTYIAAEILQDFSGASEFAKLGLRANPADAGLWNNLALAEAALGNTSYAKEALGHAIQHVQSESTGIVLKATEGFIAYRSGAPLEGAKHYGAAIHEAKAKRMKGLMERALVYWLVEEVRANRVLNQNLVEKFSNFFESKDVSREGSQVYKLWLKPLLATAAVVETGDDEIAKFTDLFISDV